MLDAGGRLPVERAHAPALQQVGIPPRNRAERAEGAIRERAALAIGVDVRQVAVGHVVAVGVGPGAVRGGDNRVHRVVEARDRRAHRLLVPAQRELQCRFAVAEEVVGSTEPRSDVLVVRHVLDLREVERADEATRRPVLSRHGAVDVVEAHAQVRRQPLQRPLVLRVESQVHLDAHILRRRRGKLRERHRHASEKLVGERFVLVDVPIALPALHRRQPHFGCVGAGDVRDGEPLVVLVEELIVAVIPDVHDVGGRVGVVLPAGRQLSAGDIGRPDHRVRRNGHLVVHVRHARLKQQLVRDRVTPCTLRQDDGLVQVVDRGVLLPGAPLNPVVARAVVLVAGRHGELVLRRRLPRQPKAVVALIEIGEGGLRRVRREEGRAVVQGVVRARHVGLIPPLAMRGIEPQLVFRDGAAEPAADVVHRFDLRRRRDEPAPQLVVQVV